MFRRALKGRREWCVDPSWPTYVASWLEGEDPPTWSEGYRRFDLIHRNGPTAAAFDFRTPYTADGRLTQWARPARSTR